jgi:hypothetical protein
VIVIVVIAATVVAMTLSVVVMGLRAMPMIVPDGGRNLLGSHGWEHMTALQHYKLHGDDIITRL